ncbi:16S rRNA (uracil1498-N3)-methyltransferase [Salinibacillus kushneri]|uniref:Ribosomal RNA small subunit methyltransferase E n=1 Tax=Salinibacillus kushneri TaxID=237682 RepID=A0A1I0G2S1_9BACI|nr:16S rRNA (uracil(1498)-N(3))-methyltransferase [Salinibacillus kushneri]SET64872.1 16S rRNA (uracil1498-N3)-methyltransferase [Salinibacillus kushneri]
MQRYFVPESGWTEEKVILKDDDAHHISNVMRMKKEDHIICNHPKGKAALCEIVDVSVNEITSKIVKWLNEQKDMPVNISIAQALPKGDKLDLIVQKGTELGAYSFIPFKGDRSVVKWDQKKADKKIKRLEKIAKEASEQSHRTTIPSIEDIKSFKELLQSAHYFDHLIVASEGEAKKDSPTLLGNIIKKIQPDEHVLTVVGPEGGFSQQELEQLMKEEFDFTRFGPRILRTETAPLYFLSVMSYQFEELR